MFRQIVSILGLLLLGTSSSAQDIWSRDTHLPIDRKTRLIVTPTYPKKAWQQRLQGRVVVCFGIRPDGSTRRPYVLASSNRIFNRAAVKAVARSTYEAIDKDKPRENACRTFQFLLEPDESSIEADSSL